MYKYELPAGAAKSSNLEVNEVEVDITDLRTVKEPFDIVQNGFQLERLNVPDDINWDVDTDVRVLVLLRAELGCHLADASDVNALCR